MLRLYQCNSVSLHISYIIYIYIYIYHIYQHHCFGQIRNCPVFQLPFRSWTFHWFIFGCSVPWPLQRTLLPQDQLHHGKICQDVSQGNMQLNDVTYMMFHEVSCRQGKPWHEHNEQDISRMINGTASTTLWRGDLCWIECSFKFVLRPRVTHGCAADCCWLILPRKVH